VAKALVAGPLQSQPLSSPLLSCRLSRLPLCCRRLRLRDPHTHTRALPFSCTVALFVSLSAACVGNPLVPPAVCVTPFQTPSLFAIAIAIAIAIATVHIVRLCVYV